MVTTRVAGAIRGVAGGGGRCDGVDAIEGNSLPRFWEKSMGRAKSHNDETWRGASWIIIRIE
jgi:hypothetical protein